MNPAEYFDDCFPVEDGFDATFLVDAATSSDHHLISMENIDEAADLFIAPSDIFGDSCVPEITSSWNADTFTEFSPSVEQGYSEPAEFEAIEQDGVGYSACSSLAQVVPLVSEASSTIRHRSKRDALEVGSVEDKQPASKIRKRSGKWTKAEDEKLLEAVETYGDKCWKALASAVGSRTPAQCLHRWKQSLKPTISRTKWTKEEDEKLLLAVEQYQRHWSTIAQVMGNRTGAQCRERFCNKLDPTIFRGAWEPAEDEALLQAVALHGAGHWSSIGKTMNSRRTDYQIRKRWFSLTQQSSHPQHTHPSHH